MVDDRGADIALVAFGGIAGALNMPPFEFFNLTRELRVTRVFVRDLHQAWYQRGVPELGDDPASAAQALGALLGRIGIRKVTAFGNSAGGFAALFFGSLIGADQVHAFAPQTFLDAAQRARYRDDRWGTQIAAVNSLPADRVVLDLTGLDLSNRFHIHYAARHRLDRIHARRMRATGARLHPYWLRRGHAIIRSLRDSGRLQQLVVGALGLPQVVPEAAVSPPNDVD